MFGNRHAIPHPSVLFLAVAVASGGCSEAKDERFALQFDASVGGEGIDCSRTYTGLGTTRASARLADARLFIAAIELRSNEVWTPFVLEQTPWQHESIALLDFENGTGACQESGTTEVNTTVTGSAPSRPYDAIRFEVGVPFASNHLDSATAPSPLNVAGMFWTWQSGYKFVRVDWLDARVPGSRFNVHIGASGCVSEAAPVPPSEPCARSNRSLITLESYDPLSDTVSIDFAALIAASDITQNVENSPPGCMTNPSEAADCNGIFSALGLSFEEGSCRDDCLAQTVFSH